MVKSHNFRYYYLPLIVYAIAIYVFSCMHKVPLPQIDRLSTDKIYHVIEYSMLGYLLMRVFDFKMAGRKTWLLVLSSSLLGALYGVSDEIHQYFVPGRYFSYWDMAADGVGTVLGCWIYVKYNRKMERLFGFLK